MVYPSITLKKGKEQSLLRFHPWIFSGAIASVTGNPGDGDIVTVQSASGDFLAVGHYQESSISVRVLSFTPEEIDTHFWINRISRSFKHREQIGLASNNETNIYRLVHGEGDGLPGLIIDIYGSTAVIQCHSAGMYRSRESIARAIVASSDGKIDTVFDKSNGTLNLNRNFSPVNEYLIGKAPEETVFYENDCRFSIAWEEGQKTGFFIDQRENRRLLSQYANGCTVLNTFGYTGGFSVYALKGGAHEAVTVDSSERAIHLADKNIELNFGNSAKHRGIATDAFSYLRKTDRLFDIIVLDPPAFAKHGSSLRNALQAYKRLNLAAIRRLKPGGLLFTFSCSQVVSRTDFRNAVFSACAISGRSASILHQLTQPADHPVNIYHPEGEYLKGLVVALE